MENAYEFREINTKFIFSDQTYQRPIDPVRVTKIIRAFDPNLVNPPKLSFRDGRYYVYDGGHTISVLKIRNGGRDLPVLCKVTYGLTRNDEAILFEEQNGDSRAVEVHHKLRSMLYRGDESVVRMVRIAELHGFMVTFNKGAFRDHIVAVSALMKIFTELGPVRYSEFLSVLRAAWDGSQESLRREILEGLAIFLTQYDGQFNRALLIKKLRVVSPIDIYRDGQVSRSRGSRKFAQQIVNIYNTGMKNRLGDVK
jgi:hypothetical protein